jgi:hypothetical protein
MARRPPYNCFGYTAHEDAADPGSPVRPHHNQVARCFPRDTQDFVYSMSIPEPVVERDRQIGDTHLVKLFPQRIVFGGLREGQTVNGRRRDVQEDQTGAVILGQRTAQPERSVRMIREIGGVEDGIHLEHGGTPQ